MAIRFTKSAGRHGVSQQEALHAVFHHVNAASIEGEPGDKTMVFVGLPHPQARRFIEVIASIRGSADIKIFHAMEVTDAWKHLVYEAGHTEWENES
ncbi:hypothetical protein [Actinomyces mediterranea]|uniref:hypothetical protein n=1 Tax=Actinomyces mediterranea TaxID=1871028 RepID=UPI00101AD9A8|nr:hypothetical protein [Actinomyces mediterranea]